MVTQHGEKLGLRSNRTTRPINSTYQASLLVLGPSLHDSSIIDTVDNDCVNPSLPEFALRLQIVGDLLGGSGWGDCTRTREREREREAMGMRERRRPGRPDNKDHWYREDDLPTSGSCTYKHRADP